MKTISLYYKEGSSDKVYQVAIEPKGELFVVNFAYGRRGATLTTGTKTQTPVGLLEAERAFNKLVNEKKSKGYTEGEAGTPYQHTENSERVSNILPQLLNPIEEQELNALISDPAWVMQEKMDGRRLLIKRTDTQVVGINRKGLTVALPLPLVRAASVYPSDFIMDGECIGNDFHLFDLLELNGQSLMSLAYRERIVALLNLFGSGQQRQIYLVHTAFSARQKAELIKRVKQEKGEGIVCKRLDAPYTPGRPNSGGSQLKHKFYATLSALVAKVNKQRSVEVSLLYGEGWRSAGNVTISPNAEVPAKGAVVEIRYLYAFKESGCLYQPTYLGPRTDLDPFDCTDDQLKFKAGGEEEES